MLPILIKDGMAYAIDENGVLVQAKLPMHFGVIRNGLIAENDWQDYPDHESLEAQKLTDKLCSGLA